MDNLTKPKRKVKPIWLPLYVAEFIADTTHLTATQGWAYINLLCAMWRSDDGTLPNDADTLARVGKVHKPRWAKVWGVIKSLFDIDGDRVTSASLQRELGKANAIIVSRRAAGQLGGLTTQHNRSMKGGSYKTHSPPKPLKYNDGVQANAKANHNHNVNKKEEGEASPSPLNGASASPKEEASREAQVLAFPEAQPTASVEGSFSVSEEERTENLKKLRNLRRTLGG
jgi:uncharacterized protein YdaU (DUF1376 family)